MRGTVRVGALQPRMSAHSSGALSEGDIVLSIDGNKVSGDIREEVVCLICVRSCCTLWPHRGGSQRREHQTNLKHKIEN